MDDVTAKVRGSETAQPRLDLQEHLADLEARGLLTRIDHPVDKDTELHPLVRLQFIGGIPESERRAFLFTNVVDASGRKYDMPVVVGCDRRVGGNLFARHARRGRGHRQALDGGDRASDPADQDQRRALPGGGHHWRRPAQARRRPQAAAGADLDAGLRLRAVSQRDVLRHQGSRTPASRTAAPIGRRLKATDRLVVRMVARAGGAGRLPALGEIQQAQGADADRDRGRRRAGGAVHRRAKARRRSRRARRLRRARRPAGAGGEVQDHRPRRSRRRRDRHRGPDRSGEARARGAVRREQRLCRARSLQHADAGHRDHAPQEPGVRLDHQPGDAERVEPGQEGRLRAAVSHAPARRARRSAACAAW